MHSLNDGITVVKGNFPNAVVKKYVEFKDKFYFLVDTNEDESGWDPFFSFDRVTGEFRDFSIIVGENAREVAILFETNPITLT